MRKPHVTTKRVFGAVLAMGLVAAGSLAVASNSEAATTPSATLSPASGAAAGGDTLQVTGKALMDKDGTINVKAVTFGAAACGTTVAGTAATTYNIVSATKATLTTPALAAGTWYLCLWDAASGTSAPLGQGKFVTAAAPTLTTINGVATATATAISSSTNGGTALTFVGGNFSKKAQVYVGGVKAATKYVSATKVTATVPAGTAGVGKAIKLSTEYGSVTSAGNTVTYLAVVAVSPAYGKSNTAVGITLTGKGFNDMVFGTAIDQYSIAIVDATVSLAAAGTVPTTDLCTNVVVEKDTVLTCKTPNDLAGAYTVALIQRDHTTATDIGSSTATSRASTFTAADF